MLHVATQPTLLRLNVEHNDGVLCVCVYVCVCVPKVRIIEDLKSSVAALEHEKAAFEERIEALKAVHNSECEQWLAQQSTDAKLIRRAREEVLVCQCACRIVIE
jgi:uncharacterized protein YhaN